MITPAGWKQEWSVCRMHIRMFRTRLEIAHHKSRVLMNQWRTIWGKEWSGHGRYQRCFASIATDMNASVCRSGRVNAWQICTVGRWGFGRRSSIISRGLWKSWNLSVCWSGSELSLGPIFPSKHYSFPGPAEKSLQTFFPTILCVWLYSPKRWAACCHSHLLVLHRSLTSSSSSMWAVPTSFKVP